MPPAPREAFYWQSFQHNFGVRDPDMRSAVTNVVVRLAEIASWQRLQSLLEAANSSADKELVRLGPELALLSLDGVVHSVSRSGGRVMKPSWIILSTALLVCGSRAHAAIQIQSEASVFDPVTNRVDFTIAFNRAPDLFTADSFGRQADAFQYWIFYDNDPFQRPNNTDALVRGAEIHVAGDLRVRDSWPPAVGEATSGGWGQIRATVPFTLTGEILWFTADLGDIGDDDGRFAYRLETYQFGALTDAVFGGTAGPYNNPSGSGDVPEPCSIVIWGCIGLTLLVAGQQPRQNSN
jgi:hypothetical protein